MVATPLSASLNLRKPNRQDLRHMDYSIANGKAAPSVSLFRFVGYGLLLLAFFDLVEMLVPLSLLDPLWEIQTIGSLVERVPVPLLGLMLVFYSGTDFRQEWELKLVKFLSRAALVMGVLFLLLAPLLVLDTLRLQDRMDAQMSTQVSQRQSQLSQWQNQLSQSTEEQIEQSIAHLPQGYTADDKNPQEVKQRLLSQVTQAKNRLRSQAETNARQGQFYLRKKVAKWFLGVIVAGLLLIGLALRHSKIFFARHYR